MSHSPRTGTLPPRRFISEDGEGRELFMTGTLMKGTAPATPNFDIPGRGLSAGRSVMSVASTIGAVRVGSAAIRSSDWFSESQLTLTLDG
jgi:hypothetical protein